MGVDFNCGHMVLLASICLLLTLPTIDGADFWKDLLACKKAGLPINCDLPVPTTTVPAVTPPSPGTPPPPASPPGSPSLPPSPPPSPTVSPPVISPAPSPVPDQAAPVPAPLPDTVAPAPAPSDFAPAPAPSDTAPAPSPLLLAPAPAPQTPPQRPITLVVSAGGEYGPSSSSIYTIATGIWSKGPVMTASRRYFPMIQLSSTEILATGGDDASAASAEIFSAVTQDWQATTSMRTARYYHSMTLLPDGSAFAAGGYDTTSLLASTELYTKGAWADGPSMGTARAFFPLLTYDVNSETRVLACGGLAGDSSIIGSCEVWNPSAIPGQGFAYLQSNLPEPVYDHRAVLLNGNPFITGGITSSGAYTNAVQMLKNGAWTLPKPMQRDRSEHEMVVLQTGEVLVCGGFSSQDVQDSCEIFDGENWAFTARLPAPQSNFKLLVLPNGDVLFYGQLVNEAQSATWTRGASAWVPIPSSQYTVPGSGSGLAGV